MGSRVVLNLASKISEREGKELFFDNLFTSPSLLVSLRSMGLRATGTIRTNRTKQAPFKSNKELRQRGQSDVKFDTSNELLMVKWNDNAFVHLATNYSDTIPSSSVERYSSVEKKKVKVSQPKLVGEYNAHMGGVDHADWLAAHYAIGIRGKKWYFPLITRGLQMAVVNAWLIHKRVSNAPLSLLEFTRSIATSYMALTHVALRFLGRKCALSIRNVVSFSSGHCDNIGHFQGKKSTRR